MKVLVLILCLFLASLFFREQTLPAGTLGSLVQSHLATNIVLHIDEASFGFRHGLTLRRVRVYTPGQDKPLTPLVSAERVTILPFSRRVEIDRLAYRRLPDSYYAPENNERHARVEATLPSLPVFTLVLTRPSILAVEPEKVVCDVKIRDDLAEATGIHLEWPDPAGRLKLDGFCRVDLRQQEVVGEVRGLTTQPLIRPFLVAMDVPVALPYFDAFTDVPDPVTAACAWKVNLVNNDFDLDLDLAPPMGKYNSVPMLSAEGKIKLHVYTRGTSLNYDHTFGPILAKGTGSRPLEGTVRVEGLDGTNTVRVTASSAMPVAQLLKIGGFTDDYVDEQVVGESACDLLFRFPRAMGDDMSLLNGRGHLEIKNGQIMRLRGFRGLLELMAEKVPGVSYLTDSTQASGDYVIENGVVKSDNIYIEGSVFSLKMYGAYDAVRDTLDFTARVQFSKKDSFVGKFLHPLAWPFTKLLLEFRLTGTPQNPTWTYLSVIDRVLDVTDL